MARGRRRRGSLLRRLGDAALGFLTVHALRAIRLFNPKVMANVRGRGAADRRAVAAGASRRPRQSRRGISGEVARRDRDDPARRLGQPRPRRRRVRPYRPAVGLRPRARPRPHHSIPTRPRQIALRLRDDGKPALVFAAHLANWELAAVGRARLRHAIRPCCTAGPTSPAMSDAVIEMRAGCMGTLIPTSMDAPVKLADALQRGSHVAMLVDQYAIQGVAGDVLRPPHPRQCADRAAGPADRMPDPRHARGSPSRRPLPVERDRGRSSRRATPKARSTSNAPCRSSPTWWKAGCASIPSNGCGCTDDGGMSS